MNGVFSRTVCAGAPLGLAPRGRHAAQAPLCWPNKDAGTTLDYAVDFSALLAEEPTTQTLSDATVVVQPAIAGGLVASNIECSGNLVTFLLTGGVPGLKSVVTVTAQTSGGLVLTAAVQISVSAAPMLDYPDPFYTALAAATAARQAADQSLEQAVTAMQGQIATLQAQATALTNAVTALGGTVAPAAFDNATFG